MIGSAQRKRQGTVLEKTTRVTADAHSFHDLWLSAKRSRQMRYIWPKTNKVARVHKWPCRRAIEPYQNDIIKGVIMTYPSKKSGTEVLFGRVAYDHRHDGRNGKRLTESKSLAYQTTSMMVTEQQQYIDTTQRTGNDSCSSIEACSSSHVPCIQHAEKQQNHSSSHTTSSSCSSSQNLTFSTCTTLSASPQHSAQ
jgi:hypothetical protein